MLLSLRSLFFYILCLFLQLVFAELHNLENLSRAGTKTSYWKARSKDLPVFSHYHKYVFNTAETEGLVCGPSAMCSWLPSADLIQHQAQFAS